MTDRLLTDAGMGRGMRVIDIGCGRGDVSFLISNLVGESGQVVGLDRDSAAIEQARERAENDAIQNINFIAGDLNTVALDERFDAAVGRRVLMYQADAVLALRQIANLVRPGGIVIFQEHDATLAPGRVVPLPLHERVNGWLWEMVRREGGDTSMGFHLAAAMNAAGLQVQHVRAEAVVQTPTASHHTGAIIRAVSPRLIKLGIATEVEIDIDTLDARLAAERKENDAIFIGEMVFGAWAMVAQ